MDDEARAVIDGLRARCAALEFAIGVERAARCYLADKGVVGADADAAVATITREGDAYRLTVPPTLDAIEGTVAQRVSV